MHRPERASSDFLLDYVLIDMVLCSPIFLTLRVFWMCVEGFLCVISISRSYPSDPATNLHLTVLRSTATMMSERTFIRRHRAEQMSPNPSKDWIDWDCRLAYRCWTIGGRPLSVAPGTSKLIPWEGRIPASASFFDISPAWLPQSLAPGFMVIGIV